MIDEAYVERLTRKVEELESRLSSPQVVGDQKKFKTLIADHLRQKRLLEKSVALVRLGREKVESQALLLEKDSGLQEMAKAELARIEQEFPAAEKAFHLALLPPDPDADRNIIMEIRAGTGGEEAGLFAGDLYRMYTRYAESKGWKTTMLDASPTDLGGFKEIVFSIEGQAVFSRMQFESGGHRVQRIPATEAGGRIHTSAATVAVLPEAQDFDEVEVRPEHIRVDVYRSSGAGGQHVNTTDSAVRITHLETGLVVQCQEERSQHKNRDKAMRMLAARLLDRKREDEQKKMAQERKVQIGSGDRSQRIRTYNFPQNRLTDHRINFTLYSLDRVMQGDLDAVLDALQDHHLEERLRHELSNQEA